MAKPDQIDIVKDKWDLLIGQINIDIGLMEEQYTDSKNEDNLLKLFEQFGNARIIYVFKKKVDYFEFRLKKVLDLEDAWKKYNAELVDVLEVMVQEEVKDEEQKDKKETEKNLTEGEKRIRIVRKEFFEAHPDDRTSTYIAKKTGLPQPTVHRYIEKIKADIIQPNKKNIQMDKETTQMDNKITQ